MRRAALPAVCAALLAGCVEQPQTYAPKQPRRPLSIEEPSVLKPAVRMNEPGAELHFIRDIKAYVEGGIWRWTGKRPTLMFRTAKDRGLKFFADVVVPQITFKDTGPQTISITINGKPFDEVRVETAGDRHIEKAVPDGVLRTEAENVVTMEIDKVWIAPADGVHLGFVLIAAGFRE